MTRHFEIVCQVCARPTSNDRAMRCAACGGTLGFRYAAPDRWPAGTTRVWDHAALLPIARDVAPVTLGEGGTPLIAARGDQGCRLHWKIEGANPTGSQKDRALALALTHARATGARRVVVASTGSVGLACAAYGARAGIPCLVLLPDGTPTERVRPMLAFGATVAAVQSTFETIERLLQTLESGW
jgi:threonine synthase